LRPVPDPSTDILWTECRSADWEIRVWIANKFSIKYRRETALQGGLVMAKSERLKMGESILRTFYLQPRCMT